MHSNRMTNLRTLLAAPLGNVLNRFSKDTEVQDTEQVENLQPVLDYSVQVLFVASTYRVL